MNDELHDDWAEGASGEPLGVGDVLATTFRTIGANLGSTVGLCAAVFVPAKLINIALQVVQFHVLTEVDVETDPEASLAAALASIVVVLVMLAVAIVTMLGIVLVAGAITHVTIETLLGRRATTGAALRASLGRTLPLIGTAILTGVLQAIGMFLCIAPGVIAWVWLVLALPACLAEKVGPIDAMQRSIELTEGHRLTIFVIGVVLVVALVSVSLCAVSPALVMGFQQLQEGIESGAPGTATLDPLSPLQLVSDVFATLLHTFGAAVLSVVPAVLYVRLRGLRESVDAKVVAQVFA